MDYAADAAAAELVRILDQHLADLKAGRAVSRTELIARHPALASQLEDCLAGLEFIHGAETAAGHSLRLGDFQIIREVGRGGMGAVFEAEQISLGRRVALKILRFGGVSGPDAIERFQREAETVAKLHHTNIVPIFAVGTERGVNYYAMQFIDGQSLAEVLAKWSEPLSPDRVADWGLQAAEALAHAHQRGVVHRDVKPSNLLLDRENRIWLTDFGLARRLDDVTLSLTGALLGTPRYMSPEQAAASKKRIDHRSDLFSLGATLYELLAAKPAFPGDSPHDVIQCILTCEPTPLRQIAKEVPRDLETIVMKCLAKEPDRRYGSARDLADDLRAFLDGRPIRARRASSLELAARWFKSRQRSVKLAAAAATVTLAITLLFLVGRSSYDAWRQGSIKLSTSTPPLVAEILDESGRVLRRETVPTQQAVSLPAGEYQIRATAEGSLSQSFDVELVRATEFSYSLDLRDRLLSSHDVDRVFTFVDLGKDRLSIVEATNAGISLFGVRPPPLRPDNAALKEFPGFRWPWKMDSSSYSGFGVYDLRPWFAPRGFDLNGDGARDLICAGRHQAWLMAISGQDGTLLWFAGRGTDLQAAPDNRWLVPIQSTVFGEPIIDQDCDSDGTPDVIATLGDAGAQAQLLAGDQLAARIWVEALSGRTGQTIWKYELPPSWFELPAGEEVPYQCRWFVGASSGQMSTGGSTMRSGRFLVRESGCVERTGTYAYRPEASRLIEWNGRRPLAVVAGKHVALLEADSGKEMQTAEMDTRPGRPVQWGDLDGDGSLDLVVLSERPVPAFQAPHARVVAWSLAQGKRLWAKDLDAYWPRSPEWTVTPPQWPLVVDLDGDRRCEVVLPDGRSGSGSRLGSDMGTPWGRLAAMEGATGRELWGRRIVSMERQLDHLGAGPDIDGDGWRDVYTATLCGPESHIYVDAFSGQSGCTLWISRGLSAPAGSSPYLEPPKWWNAGEDGWPQLVVQAVDGQQGRRQSLVCLFSAGTGRMTASGYGITGIETADVDRDGIEELLVFDALPPANSLDFGGKLHVVRGVAAEPWRRLGPPGRPAADFDGDGVVDLVVSREDGSTAEGTITARSGRTGSVLWRTSLAPQLVSSHARSADADLDADGTTDLLVWVQPYGPRRTSYPFHAVSGRTGKILWNAREIGAEMVNNVLAARAADLDHDGQPEVLWLAASDHGYPANRQSWSSHDVQLRLFVTSGQSGKLRWSQPLSRRYGESPGDVLQLQLERVWLSLAVGDVSGDGIADVIVPAIPAGARQREDLQTRVFSGRDGKLLWNRSFALDRNRQPSLDAWVPPAVCDLDGDGQTEVVTVETVAAAGGAAPTIRIVALRGHDGSQLWSWDSGMLLGLYSAPLGRSLGDLLRPVPIRFGGQRAIAALLGGGEARLVVLDAQGKVRERKLGHQAQASGMWVLDANGDGNDELAFIERSLLVVVSADDLERPLWTRDTRSAGEVRIVGVLPSASSHQSPGSATIALVESLIDNTVRGLDAATGSVVWQCPGPVPRAEDGTYLLPNQLALLGGRAGESPFVYYAYSFVSRVRQAVTVAPANQDPAPRGQSPLVAAPMPKVSVAAAVTSVSARDVRWERGLPWADEFNSSRAAAFFGWCFYFSTLLVVIPGAYLVRLAWLRRFSLMTLLALPVVAALVLTGAMTSGPADNDFGTLRGKLLVAAGFAPAVIALALIGWWGLKGQWRRVLFWLAISVVMGAVCGAVAIGDHLRYSPLNSEETYDWTGWYLIWFPGAFMTAWLMVILLPLKLAAVGAWKWWRARRGPALAAALPREPTLAVNGPTELANNTALPLGEGGGRVSAARRGRHAVVEGDVTLRPGEKGRQKTNE